MQGLNAYMLSCLRDARSACFNEYPNLSFSLIDPNVLGVSFNIKTHWRDFLPKTDIIAILHPVCLKILSTIAPKAT